MRFAHNVLQKSFVLCMHIQIHVHTLYIQYACNYCQSSSQMSLKQCSFAIKTVLIRNGSGLGMNMWSKFRMWYVFV